MWAGVDRWDDEEMIHQAVHAVRQIATGEELKPSRPLGGSTIILIVAGMLFLIVSITSLIIEIFGSF
jgi:hypothetical protein